MNKKEGLYTLTVLAMLALGTQDASAQRKRGGIDGINHWVRNNISKNIDYVLGGEAIHDLGNAIKKLPTDEDINRQFIKFNRAIMPNLPSYSDRGSFRYSPLEGRIDESLDTYKTNFPEIVTLIDAIHDRLQPPEAISKEYILAKMRIESGFNPHARSDAGARGLMQITKGAWEQVDASNYYANVNKPQKNIEVGIKYEIYLFNKLQQEYQGFDNLSVMDQQRMISASYNGGPEHLRSVGFNIDRMWPETKQYVADIDKLMGY